MTLPPQEPTIQASDKIAPSRAVAIGVALGIAGWLMLTALCCLVTAVVMVSLSHLSHNAKVGITITATGITMLGLLAACARNQTEVGR